MKSKILKEEVVENLEPRTSSAKYYYPCRVITHDGKEFEALFTENQIKEAIVRGVKNPEDIEQAKSFLQKFFDDVEDTFDSLFE